jgi:hypothetical protein
MADRLMLGLWRFVVELPPSLWEKQIRKAASGMIRSKGFMTPEHVRVHHFVVRELPFVAASLSPARIAEGCELSLDTVSLILDDLERHMTFLFRNDGGDVIWAYPVTVDQTPHKLAFDTGEKLWAA